MPGLSNDDNIVPDVLSLYILRTLLSACQRLLPSHAKPRGSGPGLSNDVNIVPDVLSLYILLLPLLASACQRLLPSHAKPRA